MIFRVSGTGGARTWAWLVPGVLVASGFLAGEVRAQGPGPVYEKLATWAETITALRGQAIRQPLFGQPRPAFGLGRPGRSANTPPSPQMVRPAFGPGRFGRSANTPPSPQMVRPAFGPGQPGRSPDAPPHPLVALWAQLEQDFPLECDWMLQDLAACGYPCSNPEQAGQYPIRWFGRSADADLEKTLLLRVIEELGTSGAQVRSDLDQLMEARTPPHTQPWLDLYARACLARRVERLRALAAKCSAFVFTKHFNMGGSHYTFTEGLSDAQSERHFVPGSSLCLLELHDGSPTVRTLLSDPSGVIRDPDVAYEGDRVLFAWKKSDRLDDYHLHELDLASGKVRQLTFGLGFADYEGVYLPSGDLLFNSTRCVQVVDCFFTEVSNLYTCDRDGRFLRRVAFDQVHTNYPTVTEDGRVLYTRWEYNDRGQIFTQALFQMNADGTNQTECYGNNSYFPTAILHARQIPGSQEVLAIAAGHHTPQNGKLILLDPARGRQENQGAQLVAPIRPTPSVRVDTYGQRGELWQYPYPLSETEFLVSYNPWGETREPLLFGVYFMTVDGRRELLAFDPDVSCNQPVPLRRPVPRQRTTTTDYRKPEGTFYIQDVYAGPGLAGIPRGTAKKVRVIGLDFRPTVIGGNHNRGEAGQAFVATPVAVAQGSWEVKTILGEAPICADGSVFFTAPARTPVYFQVIDDKGHMIQTMRSWATLQPGENGACVGCHEHKNDSPPVDTLAEALRHGPRPLDPFYGPPRGFSFPREIQPILDRHCIECHHDRSRLVWLANERNAESPTAEEGTETAFSLLATTTTDWVAKRRFSDGYLALTGAVWGYDQSLEGTSRALVNWISPQSGPPMRQPYAAGSATSDLMTLLEEGHQGVSLSREETDKLACWIDLVVPYCGDYLEANAWGPLERGRYNYFLNKRKKMQAAEARNIRQLIASRGAAGIAAPPAKPGPATLPLFVEVTSGDGTPLLQRQTSGEPGSFFAPDLPRPLQAGDRIHVQGTEDLAVQCDMYRNESLIYLPEGRLEWTVPARTGQVEQGGIRGTRAAESPRVLQLSFRPVASAELSIYRNLAANPYDFADAVAAFPHASASNDSGNEPMGAARNAITQLLGNDRNGGWRCRSRDIGEAADPWWQVDFGRLVDVDKVVICQRPDLPDDHYWCRATIVFSDGHRQTIDLKPTSAPQVFVFEARRTTTLRLTDFVQDELSGECTLADVEVWGRDRIPVATDLSVPSR